MATPSDYDLHHNNAAAKPYGIHTGCRPLADDSYWHGYVDHNVAAKPCGMPYGLPTACGGQLIGTVMLISPRHHE